MMMSDNTEGSMTNDLTLIDRDGNIDTKSPWKTSPVEFSDTSVMGGAQSWPALSAAAQQPRPKNPPITPPSSENVPISTQIPTQAVTVQGRYKTGAKANPGYKNQSSRYSKPGSRFNQNGPPLPLPYHMHGPYQPPFQPMMPLPNATGPEYPYAPYPYYPVPGAPGNEQRGFDPRYMPQGGGGGGPRNYFRPPYMGPAPGYLGSGPMFPGGSGYYMPMPPYAPHFAPYPAPAPPLLSPEKLILQDKIRKQIEYYFSEQNLQTDNYLKSLMDEQGWVPAATIAGFRRVKAMTMDVEFVVYALGFSTSVEVQGDKMRKRHNWSKWISVEKNRVNNKGSPENTTSRDNFGNPSKGSSKPTMCNLSSEGAQSSRTSNDESDNLKSSVDEKRNVDDLSTDFSNTNLLDEELDRSPRKSGLSMSKSIEYEDDDKDISPRLKRTDKETSLS